MNALPAEVNGHYGEGRRAAHAMHVMARLYGTGQRGEGAAFSEPRAAVRS